MKKWYGAITYLTKITKSIVLLEKMLFLTNFVIDLFWHRYNMRLLTLEFNTFEKVYLYLVLRLKLNHQVRLMLVFLKRPSTP